MSPERTARVAAVFYLITLVADRCAVRNRRLLDFLYGGTTGTFTAEVAEIHRGLRNGSWIDFGTT